MAETPGTLRFHQQALPSADEQLAAGRAARKLLPRGAHAEYVPPAQRDPIGILQRQNATRLPDLVPLRVERMLANPFAFYRGSAALQAADLAHGPMAGWHLTVCGDAHLANFGLFASPQRTMVFDLNDFDESAYGPWEWDVKRFVTSVVIAARHKNLTDDQARAAALEAAASYRRGLREFHRLGALDRYYLRADVARATGRRPSSQRVIDQALRAAAKRTSARVVRKITERDEQGRLSIIEAPPVLTHVPEATEGVVAGILERYSQTVSPDIAVLLSSYHIADVARRVVGVGSVGTRCYIAILVCPGDEPLVLQVKEATRSVIDEYGGVGAPLAPELGRRADNPEPGFRVVASQRILQSVSDPFLGHVVSGGTAYYVRQFRDRNVSMDLENLEPRPFMDYVDACAVSLARAHAQSPAAGLVAGYLGSSTVFDEAVAAWSMAYADQSLADFHALQAAAALGG